MMFRLNPHPRLHALPTLAAALVFAVAFAAGQWQSGRAAEKDVIEARHAALHSAPALALPRAVTLAEAEPLDGRRLRAEGEFLNGHTMYLDNQVLNRRAGYHVLTPFRAANGAVVLVNRGWAAQGRSRADLPVVKALTGNISIEGRAALPPRRIYEIKPDAAPGKVWQNLLLPAMSKQAGVDLLPFVLRLTSDTGDGLQRVASGADSAGSAAASAAAGANHGTGLGMNPAGTTPADINPAVINPAATKPATNPGMTAAKHRGYAFQWYGLAALTAVLFLFFTFVERSRSP